MTEIPDASLADISVALVQGRTSSELLVREYFSRIDRLNSQLHAFVCIADKAVDAARESDRRRQKGHALGPLDGVPIAIKDLFDVRGLPTGGGSKSQPDTRCESSAEVVRRLEDAGMIVLGKTSTVELGCGGWGTQSATPIPWNPWDMKEHRVPGGSSSGSAVAVAAGLAPIALGSDTGGSVRIPASFCGTVGFKPSPGILPVDGILPLGPTHDTVGIISQSVADAALLFGAMVDGSERQTSPLENSAAPSRIAFLPDAYLSSCSSDVADLYRSCADQWRGLGHQVSPIILPWSFDAYTAFAGELTLDEAYALYGEKITSRPEQFGAVVSQRILSGRFSGPLSFLLAQRIEAHVDFAARFSDFDFFATPTCPFGAIRLAEVDENQVPTLFTRFANYLDLPAIHIPMGFDRNGLPVGLQLMAANDRDEDLLKFAAEAENHIGFKHRRPPLWRHENSVAVS